MSSVNGLSSSLSKLDASSNLLSDGSDAFSSSESVDALVREANDFLAVVGGKNNLVTMSDWAGIREASKRRRHRSSPSRGLCPFVPHSSADLRVGNVVRLVYNERLISGVVRLIDPENLVGVDIQHHDAKSRELLLPIENMMACIQ